MKLNDKDITAALGSSAKSISMNSDAAFAVLVGALGAAGMSTNVEFASAASAAAAAASGTSAAGTALGIGIAGVATGVAVYTIGTWAPTISSVNYNTALTSNDLPIEIEVGFNFGISQVYAVDDSGIKTTAVKQDDGTYLLTISDNGSYVITADAANGKSAVKSISINTIDKKGPELVHYVLTDGILKLTYSDSKSGVDILSAYAQSADGTVYEPIFTDSDTGEVDFEYDLDGFSVYIKDTLGNQSVHVVTTQQ